MSEERMAMVELAPQEIGYLYSYVMGKVVADPGDRVARTLWMKLRGAAVSLNVEWRYGELPPAPAEGH